MNFGQALAGRLNKTFGEGTFTAPPSLSRKAKAAIAKYGTESCRMAYRIHTERGEGAASIALSYPVPNVHTTRQADSAIDAGRELAEGRK